MANTTGKKFGGRRKGTPNKKTEALRARVENLIDDNWDKIQNDLKELSGKERVDTIVKLLEYSLPKLSRTEFQEVSTVEELLMMTPEERRERIQELRSKLKKVS
ncbi:hypothetical protein [Flagellimonas okinawensis]|uniref:Uncharacterized protein n=1 Tax=Flagellimonas okinawensis TaxID=3031324 RepID=A0ABT5XL47_9FLAO|nr:hypothetical protein [[Muricauda] okinawensis]MDF0706609.1 hypothetical protein [[Muricauda] okinawensis]